MSSNKINFNFVILQILSTKSSDLSSKKIDLHEDQTSTTPASTSINNFHDEEGSGSSNQESMKIKSNFVIFLKY